MKFFLILIIIFLSFLLGTRYLLNKLKRIFTPFEIPVQKQEENKYKDVLYQKDEIIVLKGDAKDKK